MAGRCPREQPVTALPVTAGDADVHQHVQRNLQLPAADVSEVALERSKGCALRVLLAMRRQRVEQPLRELGTRIAAGQKKLLLAGREVRYLGTL